MIIHFPGGNLLAYADIQKARYFIGRQRRACVFIHFFLYKKLEYPHNLKTFLDFAHFLA